MTFAPNLFLHDSSRRQLEHFIKRPSHGLLLHGPDGMGLTTTARTLANVLTDSVSIHEISPIDGKDISIELIRKLYELTRSSTTNGRAVIIDQADMMSIPAQNSLLKLLEEPPQHTFFILTSHTPAKLLDTIQSRTQSIALPIISNDASALFLDHHTLDSTKRSQILFLGAGRPALLHRLATDESYFAEQASLAKDARTFVQSTAYQRLIISGAYVRDRTKAIAFLAMVGAVVYHMVKKNPQNIPPHAAKTIGEAIDRLQQNGNVRLALTDIALSF